MVDVAIIDYKSGNLYSVQAACNKVGLTSLITSDHNQILDARTAILPGVGAFGEAMSQLGTSRLDECIFSFISSGRPFVGICLGFQLLFESSEEYGEHKGLEIIQGAVKKLSFEKTQQYRYPVPKVGWSKLQPVNSWDGTLLHKNEYNDLMYFTHSYYVKPKNEAIVLATTAYGNNEYCSAIQYKNVFATQFHPEKSGKVGIKIYQTLKANLTD